MKWTIKLSDKNGEHKSTTWVEIGEKESPSPNLDIDLQPCHKYTDLTMSADFVGGGGQCLDRISKFYPENKDYQRLVEIWKRWHLNGLKAGTRKQIEVVNEFFPCSLCYDYDDVCGILKEKDLYEDGSFNERGKGEIPYKYGHAWLVEILPDDIKTEVAELCKKLGGKED